MTAKIAFLGPKATFTDLAVSRLFPNDIKIPMNTIRTALMLFGTRSESRARADTRNALEVR